MNLEEMLTDPDIFLVYELVKNWFVDNKIIQINLKDLSRQLKQIDTFHLAIVVQILIQEKDPFGCYYVWVDEFGKVLSVHTSTAALMAVDITGFSEKTDYQMIVYKSNYANKIQEKNSD